jgi:hypothetical protein
MKKTNIILATALFSVASASATTVNISGSPSADSFFGTDSVALDSSGVDTVEIGYFTSWASGSAITDLGTMGFTSFGDAGVGSVFGQIGKLLGGDSDNTGAATTFNGQLISFVVTDGDTGNFGVVSGPDLFPANNFGVGDTINVDALLLDNLDGFTAVAGGYQVNAIPEPSTFAALAGLCALGAVMVRRRRA